MKDFRFLDYHTEYSCTGSINKEFSIDACFAYVFARVTNNDANVYNIIVYKGNDLVSKGRSNACFMTRRQLKNHINILRDLFPIKSTVREITIETYGYNLNAFEVTLDISGVPATFHKYALTWLRYTYEYPYNVILMDSYRLKQEPEFRFESISNLFNIVSVCYDGFYGGGHSAIYTSHERIYKPLTRKDLKKSISKQVTLNNLFKLSTKHSNKVSSKSRLSKFTNIDIEYWVDDELFIAERKPIYMSVFNKIKK